jgi:AraC-like DNA-binding protein
MAQQAHKAELSIVGSSTTLGATPLGRWNYDGLQFSSMTSGRWMLRFADSSSVRDYFVLHALDGTVTLGGAISSRTLSAGDFLVLRGEPGLDVPAFVDAALLVVRVPLELTGPHGRAMAGALGRVIHTDSGTPSIVAHLLQALAKDGGATPTGNPGRLAQHVVGLLSVMCLDAADQAGVRPSILQSAKEYIESNLGESDLSPDRVAAALNVSTRTLHRLFEGEGVTISAWTRARRLENCRVELIDASVVGDSVSAVGARWGLWDAAHFSRLFKSAYGTSPRAYRAKYFASAATSAMAGRELVSA